MDELGGDQAYKCRRLRAQTDLKFLSRDIFHRDVFDRTHDPIFNFFLKKSPYLLAFDPTSKYTLRDFHKAIENLSSLSQRKGELLYPRGTYKSSFDADDICQYVVCFPDIRILIMVGDGSLGEAFVPEIKQRFVLEDGDEPTEFQLLFPEFVIDKTKVNASGERDANGTRAMEDKGGEGKYWSPARRIKQKEATIGSLSILGSTSGWHADVMKADDVITDTTPVETAAARNKILRKFVGVINLLEAHSILELIGTRYHEEDLYAHFRKELPNARYLCGASWIVLPHALEKKPRDLTPFDVELLFPEVQTYEYLMEKLVLDEDTFFLQQLNDARNVGPKVTFRREDLMAVTAHVPQDPDHIRYNFWDVATSDSAGSDFSVGIFVTIDPRAWIVYLQHMVVDKFTPMELARNIAELAKQTQPKAVFFEKYVATSEMWLEQEVKRIGVTMGYDVPVWAEKTDKRKLAKGNRICGLEPLIKNRRLWFSNAIPNMGMLYDQFCRFTGVPDQKRHDDIPDCISFVLKVLPAIGLEMPMPPAEMRQLGMQTHTNEKTNAAWLAGRETHLAQVAWERQAMGGNTSSLPQPDGQPSGSNPIFPDFMTRR